MTTSSQPIRVSGWSTTSSDATTTPTPQKDSSDLPNGDSSPAERLRFAVELEKKAKALKDDALEDLKAEIAAGSHEAAKTEGECRTYRFTGITLTRSVRIGETISSKAKERIEELKGDLKQEGLITAKESETWTVRAAK